MSDFNSIISSITGQPAATVPSVPKPKPRPGADVASKDLEASGSRPFSPLKRKLEDGQTGPPSKLSKPNGEQVVSGTINRPSSSSGLAPKLAATSLNKTSLSSTARHSQQPASVSPINRGTTQNAPSAPSTFPKKGSYKDMMARARAAQSTQPSAPPVGQIKHSASVSKKKIERREAREQARQAHKTGSGSKDATVPLRPDSPAAKSSLSKKSVKQTQTEAAARKKKERPPLEYKGTMRGSANSSASKAVPNNQTTVSRNGKQPYGNSSGSGSDLETSDLGKKYTYADDSDEEDDGYDSEGSSDMEGGGFDTLEAEEEASLRAARKEDAQALQEEETHRLEKLERKKKLQQLASRAPKQRF